MESFLKHTTNQSFKKMLQRNEALEYDNSDEHDFAVKLVSEIDDKIGSIDSEIDKDLRSGKTTGKRLGIQVVLEDGKRRLFVEYASDIIKSDKDLELKKIAASRAAKDFIFSHKDLEKDIYVQTRPDGQRGGGATGDPNELMTAALCTLSKIPDVDTLVELDALIETVIKIVNSGKIIGYAQKDLEAMEKNYGNLVQAVSAAQVIQKNYGIGAKKVYMTGKSWDKEVQQFQITKYGMRDYNSSDFIMQTGNKFLGVSLKKKKAVTETDPTLINKAFDSILAGPDFEDIRNKLNEQAGEFYVRVIKIASRFQRLNPKKAVDKSGAPWLTKDIVAKLGPNARNINLKNWKDFVRSIPNDVINHYLKQERSWFAPLSRAIVDNSDLFAEQLLQLLFKMDLKDMKKFDFDFALVTGIGRYLVKGPVVEKGDYIGLDTMVGVLDKLLDKGQPKMVLDKRKKQAYEPNAGSATLHFRLAIGTFPIADLNLRYAGNFRAAPAIRGLISKELKKAVNK